MGAMEIAKFHVFVCEQRKAEGLPCCSARGSASVIDALRREVARQGLLDQVQITACGSLGLCERGPNMVVYPEGAWYSGVTEADVAEIVACHFVAGVPVTRLLNMDADAVRAEVAANRNRYLQSIRAREAAGAMPDELVATIRAFQDSRVILTAIELDAFTAIGEGATAEEAAARMGADARATGMLLHALVALGLLVKRDGRFFCAPAAARHFQAGSPFDTRVAMGHFSTLWRTWSRLTEAVRAGSAPAYDDLADRGDEWTEPFIAAMHRIASEAAPAVVGAVGPAGVARMLDVGGGSGAYSIAFAKAEPGLHSEILDLPAVLAIARRHIDAAGLSGRIETRAGDLTSSTFGAGYHLVFISAICHMLSEEQNADLIRRAHAALAPGGRIVIQDFFLDPDRTSPKSAALFALNMLAGTRSGNTYTEGEYRDWMRQAGFGDAVRKRLPGPANLLIAARA
jgi:(2Fe-2S) ferredoxin/predicted O-methyltransferase YrrM